MSAVYQVVQGFVDHTGAYWENVLNFENQEDVISDPYHAARDLADSYQDAVASTLRPLMGSDCLWNLLSSKRITNGGGPTGFEIINFLGSDTHVGITTAFAADVACYPGGARNRPGHIYIGGVYDTSIASGAWTSAFRTKVDAYCAALLAFGTTLGGNHVAFGTFTKSSTAFVTCTSTVLKPKVTALNKRTLPVT